MTMENENRACLSVVGFNALAISLFPEGTDGTELIETELDILNAGLKAGRTYLSKYPGDPEALEAMAAIEGTKSVLLEQMEQVKAGKLFAD